MSAIAGAAAALQKQLEEVDHAISHLKTRQHEALEITSLDLPKTREFFKIDTEVKRVACPVCFEEVSESALRHHMANSCGGNEVVCPAIGCRERMPISELKVHVKHKCPVAKRRKWLAKQAQSRDAEKRLEEAKKQEALVLKRRAQELERRRVRQHRWPPPLEEDAAGGEQNAPAEDTADAGGGAGAVEENEEAPTEISEPHLQCEQCCHIIILGLDKPDESGAPVGDLAAIQRHLKRKLLLHVAQECPMRAVCCPNRQYGCHETVPVGKVQQHLKTRCVYEKIKDELIKKSKQRRELVLCAGCGEPQPLMFLKKHEQTECANRLVPCRNWHLGCPVQVRVKERHLHEDVTIDNTLRSCLYFGGGGARMSLEEDDIVPPWTVECWLYRPTSEESAKYYIRQIMRWRLHFLECKRKENLANKASDDYKSHMQQVNDAMSKAETMDEKDAAFARVQDAALALADGSFAVEDAILESEVASERLRLLCTAAQQALKNVLSKGNMDPAVDSTIPISLKDNMIRPPPKKAIGKKELIRQWKAAKLGVNPSDNPVGDGEEHFGADDGGVADESLDQDSLSGVQGRAAGDDTLPSTDTTDISNEEQSPRLEGILENESPEQDGERPEDNWLELSLTWPDWGWKVENVSEELVLHRSEMEMWRDHYEIQWKPLAPKPAADDESIPATPALASADGDDNEDGESVNRTLSKKEKKALAKEKKAKAKQRREEKKLRDSLRAAAEDSGDDGSTGIGKVDRKPLRDRIFEAVRRIQCFDNLFSSPHGNISLNVAGSGRVGIFNALQPLMTEKEKKKSKMKKSDFRDGVHVFDTSVDRRKWTHVAMVCTRAPKDSVTLYFDSTPMETLPMASFNLPMKWVGNDIFSFHGCVLDLRIWAKPRSTREIKSSMHDIIEFDVDASTGASSAADTGSKQSPRNSSRPQSRGDSGVRPAKTSSNGLVAWWPFEDGLGLQASEVGPKAVADVTGYRFKTPLNTDKLSVLRWAPAMDVPDMVLVVPSAQKKVELGEVIAPENTLSGPPKKISREELPCPSFRERNVCPYEIRRFHLAKRGRALMSLFLCPFECGEYVKKMDLKFHKRYICKNRRVQCRFSEYCQMSYFAHSQADHEKNECQRLDKRNAILEVVEMKNAIELCELCAEPIKIRDMEVHNHSECPFRSIPCLYKDCNDPICANQLQHHLKFDCRSRELSRTTLLVSKARRRLNYPRPWGFEMTFKESEVNNDEKDIEMGEDEEDLETIKKIPEEELK